MKLISFYLTILILCLQVYSSNSVIEFNSSADSVIVDETWQSVTLTLKKSDSSLSTIMLLRPEWWFVEHGIIEGGTYSLSFPEIGIVGESHVKSIDSINLDSLSVDSAGRYVIGTYIHHNVAILDLYFDGRLDDPVGTSEVHPFWSISRNKWVEASHLKVGEYVKTTKGISQLTFRVKREIPETVYNLEVQKEHTFYVSANALMVHNSCVKFGANFAKKVRKHINQVRNRYPGNKQSLLSPGKGGIEQVKKIVSDRVSLGGGYSSTYAGEAATFYPDGNVVYVIRPSGEFWTILNNTKN